MVAFNYYDPLSDQIVEGFEEVVLSPGAFLRDTNLPEVLCPKSFYFESKLKIPGTKPDASEQKSLEDKLRKGRINKVFHHLRYIVVIFGGLAVGFMSLLRLSITVAILNMVNQTEIYLEENPDGDLKEYFGEDYEEVGEFLWDNEIQQTIISYYMITYTIPQLLTTKFAINIGVKWSIPISVGICALSCLLTPAMAYQGWQYVTILRLLNGLGASAILPVMVHIIEHWMPPSEGTLGLTIVQFIQSILFTTSPLISGALASFHWKWAFYVPAVAALIFCFLWICLVSDSPKDSYLISEQELVLILGHKRESEIQYGEHGRFHSTGNNHDLHRNVITWTKALKVKSFYAIVCVWIFYCSSFGSFSFLLPSYMRQVLGVPIMENGMLCFIIHSGCMVSVLWPQPILRFLQGKLNLSLTASRRVVMYIICTVAISTWLLVARYHEYQVVLFSINRIFHLTTDTLVTATVMSQYSSAKISSEVYSIMNAIGYFSTAVFCKGAGVLLDSMGQSSECWSWIFISMCTMNLGIIILYSLCISSEPIDFEMKPGNSVKESA